METFIGNVSQFILDNYPQTGEVCVVLPNRRAGLFLKKSLSEKIRTPHWSPAVFSIEDFVFEISAQQPCDQPELLLTLYSIVKSTRGHEDEPFEGFCKWAPALLSDFNEADLWLADPKKLFTNLTEIKHMEHWSLGEPGLTDFQKKYLHFWDQLALWYQQLREQILSKNKAWTGLSHRLLAENISGNERLAQWKHFVFAGFNALTASQERIFSALQSSGKAKVLWDTDRYYIEDPLNEAGLFLRKQREKFFNAKNDDFQHIHDLIAGTAKEITLIAAARNVSQARAAAGFLAEQGQHFIPDETAVILADEQLLVPMLNALPARFADVNITMGYPMRNTPVYTLLQILFSLHENAARFNIRSREGELKFYHNDIIRLLRHPYVIGNASRPGVLIAIIQQIGQRNMTFVSPAQLRQMGGGEFADTGWLNTWQNGLQCIAGLQQLVEMLRSSFAVRSESSLDVEYLYQLHLSLNRVATLIGDRKEFDSVAAQKNLLLQIFGSSSIPFSGEPLAGLQVMGLLETRCLDFKNVVVVSANEGVLPAQSNQHSFIMYDLRKAFGLPVYQERDALSAYNFYRLLQRAENICLVYNTDQDTFGIKEKSRFVSQLLYELPRQNKQARFKQFISGADLESSLVSDELSIHSSPEIVTLATQKAANGFSPSLINLFRECSLKFYFRYLAGLREEKEVEENVEQNTLGTIVHAALEALYQPHLHQPLRIEHLEAMKTLVPAACKTAFHDLFPDEESDGGKNYLAGKIAQRYILNYIDKEIERITSQNKKGVVNTVLALEEELETQTTVTEIPVKFKGSADRIDSMGNVIRLIDYKTGLVDRSDLKIDSSEDFLHTDKHGKAFQVMMYAWLYLKSRDANAVLQPGIVSFRKIKQGFIHLETPSGQVLTQKTLGDFENVLMELTRKILSPDTVFTQTTNTSMCRNCEFAGICRR